MAPADGSIEGEPAGGNRLLPLLAVLAIAGWTVLFMSSHAAGTGAGAAALPLTALIAEWSMPVLLVIGIWLLVLRYGAGRGVPASEATNRTASYSPELESRLAAIDRKLGETRPADIAAAGEAGSARLAALPATGAQSRVASEQSAADVDRLAESRLENLRLHSERFRVELETREQDNLSAIRRRAEELSKALSKEDIAMRTRAGQAFDELQARFRAIRDENLRLSGELEKIQSDALRGWDRAVGDLETRMKQTIGKVVEVDESAIENARARLAALHAEAEQIDAAAAERLRTFQAEAALRRDAAVAGSDSGLAELEQRLTEFDRRIAQRREQALAGGDSGLAELEARLTEFDRRLAARRDQGLAGGDTGLAELDAHLTAFDQRLEQRREAQLVRLSELGERSEELAARMADVDAQLAGHVGQFEAASDALGNFAGDLSGRLTESRDLLASSGRSLAEITEASTRMFEQVRASANYAGETIPAALVQAQKRLGTFEQRTHSLRDAILAAEEKGAALVMHLDRAREGVPVSAETLDALGERLQDLAAQSDALAQRTRHELSGAIAELESSTQSLAARLREGQEAALSEFAATFGERSLEAVGKGLREKTEAAIAELDRAAEGAGRAGLETLGQLRGQLAEVEEMAGNLEARVAQAREKAQEEPTKDFSIEMTKITEKLNSAALDITKIFDADVPDVAWQAYMRGDYGVFTRKAVKLLSSQKAEAVFGVYRQDESFRATVNRYVHDFESMLRVVLATRNGHAMAVTLLSSDIGKLYVALAQATERLRE